MTIADKDRAMPTAKNLENLGGKLKAIRTHLGYSQEEMATAVGKTGRSRRSRVHEWEKGLREPELSCLSAYARLAGISADDLLDDRVELRL
jgi:transcriptional regulator with XRE-family HTH domain